MAGYNILDILLVRGKGVIGSSEVANVISLRDIVCLYTNVLHVLVSRLACIVSMHVHVRHNTRF